MSPNPVRFRRYSPRNAPLTAAVHVQWGSSAKGPAAAGQKSPARIRGSKVVIAAPANHSAGAAIPGRHAGAR